MTYDIDFKNSALLDIEKHKISGDQVLLKKLNKLLNELKEHQRSGTGKLSQQFT